MYYRVKMSDLDLFFEKDLAGLFPEATDFLRHMAIEHAIDSEFIVNMLGQALSKRNGYEGFGIDLIRMRLCNVL